MKAKFETTLQPHVSKRTKIPVPVELLAVVIGTAVSYFMDLHDKYGVSIINNIPTGWGFTEIKMP